MTNLEDSDKKRIFRVGPRLQPCGIQKKKNTIMLETTCKKVLELKSM